MRRFWWGFFPLQKGEKEERVAQWYPSTPGDADSDCLPGNVCRHNIVRNAPRRVSAKIPKIQIDKQGQISRDLAIFVLSGRKYPFLTDRRRHYKFPISPVVAIVAIFALLDFFGCTILDFLYKRENRFVGKGVWPRFRN